MNRVLKVVFSRAKGMFVVVSELGRACTKGSLKSVLVAVPIVLLSLSANATGKFEDQEGVAVGLVDIDGLAKALKESSVAVGQKATASEEGAVAVGAEAQATNDYAIAIGYKAGSAATNSVALGANSYVGSEDISGNENGVVSVGVSDVSGKTAFQRRIINVADGKNESDAATVKQVNAAQVAAEATAKDYTDTAVAGAKSYTDGKVTELNGTFAINANRIAQNAQGISNLNRRVGELDTKVKRTGATAAALSGLRPLDYDENNPFSVSASLGHYEGKEALAVGMFMRPTENFMVGLGASTSGSRDVMMNLGVSYRFGGGSSYGGMTKSDLAQKVVAMSQHNDALDAQLRSANIREEASAKRLNKVSKQLASTQSELKVAQKKAEVADQKLDMVMKELATLREEIQKMKQK